MLLSYYLPTFTANYLLKEVIYMKKCYNWIDTEYGEMCLFDYIKNIKVPTPKEKCIGCPKYAEETTEEDE